MKRTSYFAITLLLFSAATACAQSNGVEARQKEAEIMYFLSHPLHKIEAKSTAAECRLIIDPAKREIKSVTAQVDVTSFDSGNSNRDSHAMEVVDALTYPDAKFVSSTVTQRGDSVFAAGKLTFHGVTKDVLIAAATSWTSDRLMIDGGFNVSLTEFKIERPSLLLMPVDDQLKFTLKASFGWQ